MGSQCLPKPGLVNVVFVFNASTSFFSASCPRQPNLHNARLRIDYKACLQILLKCGQRGVCLQHLRKCLPCFIPKPVAAKPANRLQKDGGRSYTSAVSVVFVVNASANAIPALSPSWLLPSLRIDQKHGDSCYPSIVSVVFVVNASANAIPASSPSRFLTSLRSDYKSMAV